MNEQKEQKEQITADDDRKMRKFIKVMGIKIKNVNEVATALSSRPVYNIRNPGKAHKQIRRVLEDTCTPYKYHIGINKKGVEHHNFHLKALGIVSYHYDPQQPDKDQPLTVLPFIAF
jgi:hypothetical protein